MYRLVERAADGRRVPARQEHAGLRAGPRLDDLAGDPVDVYVGHRAVARVVRDLVTARVPHVVERHQGRLLHRPVLRDLAAHDRQAIRDAHASRGVRRNPGNVASGRCTLIDCGSSGACSASTGAGAAANATTATASAATATDCRYSSSGGRGSCGTRGHIGPMPPALDPRRGRSGPPLYDQPGAPPPRTTALRDRARARRARGRPLAPRRAG